MDNEQQNLKKQFDSLPPELQTAISSVGLPQKLQQIVKNNKLLLNQADSIQTETYLVLLGLEPLDDYIGNIVKNAGLDKNQALAVAHDMDELVFKDVREHLKTISQKMTAEERAEMEQKNLPAKEDILAGIEAPHTVHETEESISLSSLPSNRPPEEIVPQTMERKLEIKPELPVPEVKPGAFVLQKPIEPPKIMYHENVPPVSNIVGSKMAGEVAIPKKEVVIEEKTKLPEKKAPSSGTDPYREEVK